MLIAIFHWLVLILAPLYVLLGGSKQWYDLILLLWTMAPVHWSFFDHECIVSYFHKKSEDCEYTLGSSKTAEDLYISGSLAPAHIAGVASLLAGLYMTIQLGYSVPLFLIIQTVPRSFPEGNTIVSYIIPVLGFYFLRNNQYVVPVFLLTIIASFIVKHKDQNSCIVGTQVTEEPLEFKPL